MPLKGCRVDGIASEEVHPKRKFRTDSETARTTT